MKHEQQNHGCYDDKNDIQHATPLCLQQLTGNGKQQESLFLLLAWHLTRVIFSAALLFPCLDYADAGMVCIPVQAFLLPDY